MSNKRRVRSAVSHAHIVRDPRSPYWYAEFEVDAERFHKSTRQRDEATAKAVADRWYEEAVTAAARRRKTGIEPMRLWEAASAWWEHVRFGDEPDLGPFSDDPRYADRPINRLVRVIGWDKYVHDVWNPDLLRREWGSAGSAHPVSSLRLMMSLPFCDGGGFALPGRRNGLEGHLRQGRWHPRLPCGD